jgi:nicotinamidase-related amidase
VVSKIICVDFQKEFTSPGGLWFNPGRSVCFIKDILVPHCRRHNYTIHEIISDYRQPRPGDSGDGCYPGTPGYESEIPADVKSDDVWVKCMNSPTWIRENIGIPDVNPGVPYQDPCGFTQWLGRSIGSPDQVDSVLLIGLTLDWCVFCTAQELSWRGYNVVVLEEGTDAVAGDEFYKRQLLTRSPLLNWSSVIRWSQWADKNSRADK